MHICMQTYFMLCLLACTCLCDTSYTEANACTHKHTDTRSRPPSLSLLHNTHTHTHKHTHIYTRTHKYTFTRMRGGVWRDAHEIHEELLYQLHFCQAVKAQTVSTACTQPVALCLSVPPSLVVPAVHLCICVIVLVSVRLLCAYGLSTLR